MLLLLTGDARFKTLMKFLFGSPSAWLVQLHNALSFSPLFRLPVRTSRFIFSSVLKQAHQGKQYTMFECVPTPRLHKVWFPRGKWAFGMFTFCSRFCVASKTLRRLTFPFPPRCRLDVRWGKNRTLTRLLHLKRKEKTREQTNKNRLGRQQKP